jgi:hypothetical protein
MLLTRQKDTGAHRTLKDLGAERFIETSGRDFRLVNEHARAIGLNLRIREDAHLR